MVYLPLLRQGRVECVHAEQRETNGYEVHRMFAAVGWDIQPDWITDATLIDEARLLESYHR